MTNALDTHQSVYSRFFDESSDQLVKNAELNLLKLQDLVNDMLRARGHLFAYEVEEELIGMRRNATRS